jgi:hypothetical protein
MIRRQKGLMASSSILSTPQRNEMAVVGHAAILGPIIATLPDDKRKSRHKKQFSVMNSALLLLGSA